MIPAVKMSLFGCSSCPTQHIRSPSTQKQYASGLLLNDFMLARDGLWITLINRYILHLVEVILHFIFFFFSCSINLFSIFLFFLFIRITNSLWRMKLVWLYESTPIVPQMCVCDSLRTFTLCTLCSGLTWPLTENHFSPLEMKEMCGDGETSHCQSAIIWKKRRNVGWEC